MFATAASPAYILHAFPLLRIVFLDCKLWALYLPKHYTNNKKGISISAVS